MRVLTPLLLLALATVSCASTESDTPTPDLGSPDPAPAGRSPAATSGTVASSEPSVTPAAGTYLALGDSLAVGVGASQPERGGYVARVHQALESRALSNLAVSGETSGSFLDGGQMSAALQVIEEAQPPVSVVTLDIGGNDLLRLLGSDPCASGPDSAACRRTVAVTLAAFEGNYRAALGALRDALDASVPLKGLK